MLKITRKTESSLKARQVNDDLSAIHDYLLQVAPSQMAALAEDRQVGFVRDTAAEGQGLGIQTRAGLGRWSYLQLVSGGRMLQSREVRDMFDPTISGLDGDAAVKLLMEQTAQTLKQKG